MRVHTRLARTCNILRVIWVFVLMPYLPSRKVRWANLIWKITKPVLFSRPRGIRVLSQKDELAHHWIVSYSKSVKRKLRLCAKRTLSCKRSAGTGSAWSQKRFHRLFLPAFCYDISFWSIVPTRTWETSENKKKDMQGHGRKALFWSIRKMATCGVA